MKCFSSLSPRSRTSFRIPSSDEGTSVLDGSMSVSLFSPSTRKYPFSLCLMLLCLTVPSRPRTNLSGVMTPDAMDSPRPQEDSMTTSSLPSTGLAVNMTPLVSDETILWTTTAIPVERWSIPASCLYLTARSFQ